MRYPPRPSPPSAEPLRPQIWSSCALRRPRPAQSACQLESVSVSFIAARPFSSSRVASNHHLRIAQTTRIESSRRACRFRASQCRCRRRRRVVEMSRSLSSNGVGGRAPSSSRPMPAGRAAVSIRCARDPPSHPRSTNLSRHAATPLSSFARSGMPRTLTTTCTSLFTCLIWPSQSF